MGRFLVLEGLDGAGTTTQAERLVRRLQGRGLDVVRTAEPTDGPVGRLIRSTLRKEPGSPSRGTLPWMFAADRADHLDRVVGPALAAGRWVVSDRYLPSSLAYQSLDVPLELVDGLNRAFRVPDLVLYVRVPVEVALARIGGRGAAREVFEERALLERVAAAYDGVMRRLADRGWPIRTIDGAAGVDQVEAAIAAAVETTEEGLG
jgi:dTMP kinase